MACKGSGVRVSLAPQVTSQQFAVLSKNNSKVKKASHAIPLFLAFLLPYRFSPLCYSLVFHYSTVIPTSGYSGFLLPAPSIAPHYSFDNSHSPGSLLLQQRCYSLFLPCLLPFFLLSLYLFQHKQHQPNQNRCRQAGCDIQNSSNQHNRCSYINPHIHE